MVYHSCEEEKRGGGDDFVVVRRGRIMKDGRRRKFCVLLKKSLLFPQNLSSLVKANKNMYWSFWSPHALPERECITESEF